MTGVTCPADCTPGTPEFARFQRIFTGEVNSVALGFFDAGAAEVLVCEAHGSMRNLLLERLDPRVRMITGKHKTFSMMEGIQSRPELVAFVGYHTAAGEEGILRHTHIGAPLVRATLNDRVMSEGLINATLAAEFDARVVLVAGDDKTCEDAAGRRSDDARRRAVHVRDGVLRLQCRGRVRSGPIRGTPRPPNRSLAL